MKIPTPMLIEQLQQPIPRKWWDGQPTYEDLAKAESLMREAASQLEWFLNHTTKLEKEKRGK